MECSGVREALLLYDFKEESARNGNDTPVQTLALKHAQHCPSCKKFLDDMREVSRLICSAQVTAPQDFMLGFTAALAEAENKRRPFILFPVLKPALAFCVLLAAVSGGLLFPRDVSRYPAAAQKLHSVFLTMRGLKLNAGMNFRPQKTAASDSNMTAHTASRTLPIHPKIVMRKHKARRGAPAKSVSVAETKTAPENVQGALLAQVMQVIKIQLRAEKKMGNVALLLESEDDGVSFEGENKDGKVVLWQGEIPQDKTVAVLVPVKVEGKRTVQVKATVATSSDEMFTEKIPVGKNNRGSNLLTPSYMSDDERNLGECLVFLPSSASAQTQNLLQSGISVSMQTGALALSDITVERAAYVPNPEGQLSLVLADTNVDLTQAQVMPHK